MKLIIASNNAHKLTEMKAILAPFFDDVQSMREAGIEHETVEDGTTFMENAVKKAKELAEISGCCAIADDSGLCVDALDGAPGIYSARFSGVHGDDRANNRLLLEKLENVAERGAARSRTMNGEPTASAMIRCLSFPSGDCAPPKSAVRKKTASATGARPCASWWKSWKHRHKKNSRETNVFPAALL